jgi:hypothetical protein
MSGSAVTGLLRASSFVFAGTVTALGASSLRVLPAAPGLAIVRFDRGFLVNSVLGDLTGAPITVRLAQGGAGTGAVRPGQQLILFATAWVHGEAIAVNEIARLPADSKTEEEVAQAVSALPELHLSERIADAVLIVLGRVADIAPASGVPRIGSEHDPLWRRAVIEVGETLKPASDALDAQARAVLLFPGSGDIAFRNTPRPSSGQEAVFLLHSGPAPFPVGSLFAPDPADIQPVSALPTIRRLIAMTPVPG